jgi:hypothetical protein
MITVADLDGPTPVPTNEPSANGARRDTSNLWLGAVAVKSQDTDKR